MWAIDAAFELERRVGGIVGIGLVAPAGLVDAFGNVVGAEAAHRLHAAEQIVEHVAPVAQHVEDDAATVGLAIVPARALRRLPVALEHPVPELAAHRQDATEEPGIAQHGELAQTGKIELVLDDAVPDAARLGQSHYGHGVVDRLGDRLFAIDVLAGLDRHGEKAGPHLGRAGVEEQRVVGICERRSEVARGPGKPVARGDLGEFFSVASDQDRIGHHPVAVGQGDAALLADRQDRADQMLVVAHPSGDAVHDESKPMSGHGESPLGDVLSASPI